MPVYEERSTGGSSTTMLVSFLIGLVIILVVVLVVLRALGIV